jgi:hypothetical protein
MGLHVPAAAQVGGATQVTGEVPMQVPERQASTRVQALPSLQSVPSGRAGEAPHMPLAGSQVPGPWQTSLAVQSTGSAPWHAPARQASVRVHALPSLQVTPSALGAYQQAPVPGRHTPASRQGSADAGHVTGDEPRQVPPTHRSSWVQASRSSQGLQSPLTVHWPVLALQELASRQLVVSQTTGLLPGHTPAWQVSVRVHALLSLQAVPLVLATQAPLAGLQLAHWSQVLL